MELILILKQGFGNSQEYLASIKHLLINKDIVHYRPIFNSPKAFKDIFKATTFFAFK